jgi:hypothetical protein
MICPSCNQSASSLLRSAFSFQGVSRSKNIQGYFTCQHCGVVLRITGYRVRFMFFYIPTIVVLGLLGLSYRSLFGILGSEVGLGLGVLVLVISTAFTFSVWKNTLIEKVDAAAKSTTNSPA